jgi:hypothetical protein
LTDTIFIDYTGKTDAVQAKKQDSGPSPCCGKTHSGIIRWRRRPFIEPTVGNFIEPTVENAALPFYSFYGSIALSVTRCRLYHEEEFRFQPHQAICRCHKRKAARLKAEKADTGMMIESLCPYPSTPSKGLTICKGATNEVEGDNDD